MRVFLTVAAVAWLVVLALTYKAVVSMGLTASGTVFWSDFTHPWRAQFNGDFCWYLLLTGVWILYREPRRWVGVGCALAAAALGGVFFFGYLVLATWMAKGNSSVLLLGARHCGKDGTPA